MLSAEKMLHFKQPFKLFATFYIGSTIHFVFRLKSNVKWQISLHKIYTVQIFFHVILQQSSLIFQIVKDF